MLEMSSQIAVTLAFGSNLDSKYGSPEENIRISWQKLAKYGVKILKTSPIIDSEPMGLEKSAAHTPQPFKNAVAWGITKLSPDALLRIIHDIEADFGRVRGADTSIKLNREIDIDIIEYGDYCLDSNKVYHTYDLTIPHPKAKERDFVYGLMRGG